MSVAQAAAMVVAVLASIWDLKTRRIPNALTFGSAAVALAYHAYTGGTVGVTDAALGWGLGVLIFIVPFALRGLGGGDVKLLAAVGAWLGTANVVWVALYTGVAGGILALIVASYHGYLRTAFQNIWLLLCHWRVAGLTALPEISLQGSNAPKLAYALPILAGTMAVIWLR